MALPLQTIVASLVGSVFSYVVFLGVYYMNIWRAKDFPFISQLLFTSVYPYSLSSEGRFCSPS